MFMYSSYSPKGTTHDKFPCYKTAAEICICVAVQHIAEVFIPVWFAFYLNTFLHLAMDVTPACEHRRTSISTVLWRHFRVQWLYRSCSSVQLWNICPCKACLINQFPYFQLPTLLLCMLLCFGTKYIKKFWVDQSWGQLRRLKTSWWDLH